MAQKHLHELLQEDQEPFQLKHYIADRRCQLNRNPSKYSLQTVKKQKSISSPSNTSTLLCKHACFFSSIRKNSDGNGSERLSPINFPISTKSPVRKVFLHIPASTSSLLLEAAMRIQKQQNRPKLKKTQMGFGLFGSILKKFMNKKREVNNGIGMKKNEIVAELTSASCSCNHSRLSSAGWSESNEEKSMDFETSSSCRSENEEVENIEFGICEKKYSSSPISPFRFSLQKCPSSTGCRTPDFSSPAASPVRHKREDKENYEGLANIEQEEDEKEQCSPVSVLDPPFDEEEDDEDDYDESDEDIPLTLANSGKPEPKEAGKSNAGKDSASGKQKVRIVEPTKDDEDESSDDDDSDMGEDEDDSDDSEEETPKKAEPAKKRKADSATKTPVTDKKAKLTTPQKTDGKKGGGHVATPHPSKQASKTPKSAGSHHCKPCNRSFGSEGALDSHSKAKHSAGK
ncbi:uncharacterized protein LOC125823997 isoform X2 [Solanum verrucosum]|uniref:uncharacterized protein LOC125823997 isoform X2 n=1 Tax=Solanum verrucosum TaxID=315347 RepID=UPI0020D0B064|nr:uncharacterized protein LOC125823997 isoform X2 [Solanum verrucosum]